MATYPQKLWINPYARPSNPLVACPKDFNEAKNLDPPRYYRRTKTAPRAVLVGAL